MAEARPPNFVIIYCDDLGFGDLGSYGHPMTKTPHLDQLAVEGQRWTQFYSPDAVCTPSRAGLLTGRYPVRYGLSSTHGAVLFPNSAGGLPQSETTIAKSLKNLGYATACLGKWHLGHLPQFRPAQHGFDYYFGVPYSNDMNATPEIVKAPDGRIAAQIRRAEEEDFTAWDVPLLRDDEEVERPADQRTITRRYTDEAKSWIRVNRDKPFFLYLAHSMPHTPLFRSAQFKGRSRAGVYGDVIEELDASTGEIRALLEELGLAQNTLVIFSSDNGPWLLYGSHGGSAGPLRDGKGTTWEGGQRVPAIFWWPGKVKPGVVADVGSALDLTPTLLALAGSAAPSDRIMDGQDLTPALLRQEPLPRQTMHYWRNGELMAVRDGAWKAHFFTQTAYRTNNPREQHEPPLLYNLEHDLGERFEVGAANADRAARLLKLREEMLASIEPAPDQLGLKIQD
jgi:arylsulfatase A-like enzyme